MIDELHFVSPLGLLGRAVDALFLQSYLTRLLEARNLYIKKKAEQQRCDGAHAMADSIL